MQQNIQRRYILWRVPPACFSAFSFLIKEFAVTQFTWMNFTLPGVT